MRASYSALSTYKSCPLKFKYQEIDKIKVPKGKEAVFGAAVHEALRFMFKRNPLYPTIHEVSSFFTNIWNERALKIEIDEEEKNIYLEDGLALLKNFYNKNQPWNFNTVDLESRFDFALEDKETGQTHTIAGIIDRIDKNNENEYEIIDYKTASRMPSKESIDRDLQMSIYHLGILNRWPQVKPENIKLSLYFLKHNEKISTARTEKETAYAKKNVLELIKEIEEKQMSGNFPPVPSALCSWCGYKKICPMWKHEYSEPESQILKNINIGEAVSEYLDLKEKEQKTKKRLAELQSALHNFMDTEKIERIFGENSYITRRIKETEVYDNEKLKSALKSLGIFEKAIKIDETALKKLILNLPRETKEIIKAAIKDIRITKTLTVSKIKS